MWKNRSVFVFICLAFTLFVFAGLWLLNSTKSTQTVDVVYGRKFGMALTMDVMQPKTPNGIGVIFLISAGFRSDARWSETGFIEPEFYKPFLERGQTVFLISHSASPKFTVQEIVKDIYRAVRFIRYHAETYKIDPDKIAITGASSGGYLSLLVATGIGDELEPVSKDIPPSMALRPDPVDSVSARIQAAGVFYPPADLMNYSKDGQSYLEKAPDFVRQSWGLTDKPWEEQIAVLRSLSPYEFVTNKTPPIILIHGARDPYVPLRQSERFLSKLKENEVPSTLIVKEDGNHGWGNIEVEYQKVAEWFEQHLLTTP